MPGPNEITAAGVRQFRGELLRRFVIYANARTAATHAARYRQADATALAEEQGIAQRRLDEYLDALTTLFGPRSLDALLILAGTIE